VSAAGHRRRRAAARCRGEECGLSLYRVAPPFGDCGPTKLTGEGVFVNPENSAATVVKGLDASGRAQVEQGIPMSYNGFAYVIRSAIEIGEDRAHLEAGQAGWLNRPRAREAAYSAWWLTRRVWPHCFLRAVHRRFEGRHPETLRRVMRRAVDRLGELARHH
jgi:hypothetical protein